MARRKLIPPLAIVIPLFSLGARGCETLDTQLADRNEKAAVVKGQSAADVPFPDLPPACTAKVGRVIPKRDDPWVITVKRWEFSADNRDRLAADCAAWGADMKTRYRLKR